MFYYYYDRTYILVLIGVLICVAASARVNRTFDRFSRVRSYSGMTGKEAAERILRSSGIYDVQVIHIPGNLTDHYNPGNKTLGLSDTVYNSASVAAIGVAAHECGHAMQHAQGYAPLKIRGSLVPLANLGSVQEPTLFDYEMALDLNYFRRLWENRTAIREKQGIRG